VSRMQAPVAAHCRADLDYRPEDFYTRQKEWIAVTLVCGEEDCKSQGRFHALMQTREDARLQSELHQKVHAGHWVGTFPDCGHPLSAASHVVFDRSAICASRP
jgi:hypothetical protein